MDNKIFPCIAYVLIAILYPNSTAFDFLVVETKMNHIDSLLHCKNLGYDGLAVTSTPEAYNFALKVTEEARGQPGGGVHLGMTFNTSSNQMVWDDGSLPTSDTPYMDDGPAFSSDAPYAVIKKTGGIKAFGKDSKRTPLCANYHRTVIQGQTHRGYQVGSAAPLLTITTLIPTYMGCVSLCGRDFRCRAAEFNTHRLTCKTFGPDVYDDLDSNTNTTTFVRVAFVI